MQKHVRKPSDAVAKAIRSDDVATILKEAFTKLERRNNGINAAAIYRKNGGIEIHGDHVPGVSRKTKDEQMAYYKQLGHLCKPSMEIFGQMALGAPGRTDKTAAEFGDPQILIIVLRDSENDRPRYAAVTPLDSEGEYFIVVFSWADVLVNLDIIQEELLACRTASLEALFGG